MIPRILFIGLLLLVCAAAGNIAWAVLRNGPPAAVAPASTAVPMLQPSGWNPQTDNLNSQTNLNNAQANDYNAHAQLNLAMATAVVADSSQGPINAYKDGRSEGLGAGMGFAVVGFSGVAFILFLVFSAMRKNELSN